MNTFFPGELHVTHTSSDGPQWPLGQEVCLPACPANRVLYYVDSGATAGTQGDAIANSGDPEYTPASTDEAVTQYGNTGPMVWVYIKASEAIRRGHLVGQDDADADGVLDDCKIMNASEGAERVIGVAQHTIASGSYGWILKRGKGVYAGDGSVAQGEGLVVSATQGIADSAAVDDNVFGYATEDDGTTFDTVNSVVIGLAKLDCRG